MAKYELKLTKLLREAGSYAEIDKNRSGGIDALEAETIDDASLSDLLTAATVDPEENNRENFFRSIGPTRIGRMVAGAMGGRGRGLVARHSSMLAAILDAILAEKGIAGGTGRAETNADVALVAGVPAEDWEHIFGLLSFSNPDYVESRSTVGRYDLSVADRLDQDTIPYFVLFENGKIVDGIITGDKERLELMIRSALFKKSI